MSLENCRLTQKWDTAMHLLEWPKSKTLAPPNAGENVEQQELSLPTGGDARGCSHFGRQFGSFLQNPMSYPTIQQLLNFPNWFESLCPCENCMRLLKAALFIINKNWKQPRCSFEYTNCGKCIKWNVIQKNKSYQATKNMSESKCMLISEKSQSEKAMYYVIPITRQPGESKL